MAEWQGRKREPITEERLIRAVNVLAEIVREHGPAHGPLYASLEAELQEFRRKHPSHVDTAPSATSRKQRKVA